jgi:heme exporter protein A
VGALISDAGAVISLHVDKLGYRRGNKWLFRALSFQLGVGQCVWLRGQNGAGKTSLLRLVVGLAQADEGRIVCATPIGMDAPSLVYVGHANAIKDDLTAMESLEFLLQLEGRIVSKAEIVEGMRQLSVHQRCNQIVKTLSQGQRRRVALSRLALEKEASLWVLDEPFEALDVQGISVLHQLISHHLQRGGSVLLTSHVPIDASTVSLRVLDMDALDTA